MGNADLRDIASISSAEMDDIGGATVAVDAPNWLYKYLTTTTKWTDGAVYTTENGDEVPHLLGAIRGMPRFFEHDLTPLFVFDGTAHELKSDELDERRETREAAAEAAEEAREQGDKIRAARLESRAQRLDSQVIETTKQLLDTLDISYMVAPQAAESQAAYLGREEVVDYIVSEDYDSLLYGSPTTVRGFTSSGTEIEILSLEETLTEHELSWEQLVDVALCCGTDYNSGIHGVGPATAVDGILKHGDLETFLDDRGNVLEHDPQRLRELFLSPSVSDEYSSPESPAPDLERAKEFVVEEWEIPESEVSTAFERLSESTKQTGLDHWTE